MTVSSEPENHKSTLTNPTEILKIHGEETYRLRNHIQNLTPFECDNIPALIVALMKEYSPEWKSNLDDIVNYINSWDVDIKSKYPKYKGSWNCPIQCVRDRFGNEERPYYKVLRKTNNIAKEFIYSYEFHESFVPVNEWIQAEISSSKSIGGLKKKEEGGCGGRFHLLLDYLQAQAYLSKRTDPTWFPKEIAEIVAVRARKFQSIDLIYVPPTTFVWGIDSEEMFVKYEYSI